MVAAYELELLTSSGAIMTTPAKRPPDDEARDHERNEQAEVFEKDVPAQRHLPRRRFRLRSFLIQSLHDKAFPQLKL
jgi:hypothetical protein